MSSRTTTFRARWVLPIDGAPIENGWVRCADGRVHDLGAGRADASATELGDVALLPAFVNAHTHLELSWLADRVAPAASMPQWIRAMFAARAERPSDTDIAASIDAAIAGAMQSGTALFGDVTNTMAAVGPLAARRADAAVFREVLGFSAPDTAGIVAAALADIAARNRDRDSFPEASPGLDFSVVGHAPYSTSPQLFADIARAPRTAPLSVHAGESPEEIEFLQTGRGPFRQLLDDLGVWNERWTPPQCGPIEYLGRCGYLQPGMLAVHATHLSDADLQRLRTARAVIVTCPRSNVWVGGGAPDAARFYNSGVPVAVGTDSLASVASLHITDELAALHRAAAGVAPARLIESATLIGARALGRDADFGSIAAGKRAVFAAVRIPADVVDVEEYLVGGDVDASADVRLVRTN